MSASVTPTLYLIIQKQSIIILNMLCASSTFFTSRTLYIKCHKNLMICFIPCHHQFVTWLGFFVCFLNFFLTQLALPDTQGTVPCALNLQFKFPCIEEADPQKWQSNNLPFLPVPQIHVGATEHPGASSLIWETRFV